MYRRRHGSDRIVVVILNPIHSEVLSIQHPNSSTIKTDHRLDISELMLKVALYTIALTVYMHHH